MYIVHVIITIIINIIVNITFQTLNRDQQILYKLCEAVVKGKCTPELATSIIGPLNHVRWITLAARILCVYMSTKKPSKNMMDLVLYICGVYYPTISFAKLHDDLVHGSRIVH
jgi:hypothetical protein